MTSTMHLFCEDDFMTSLIALECGGGCVQVTSASAGADAGAV